MPSFIEKFAESESLGRAQNHALGREQNLSYYVKNMESNFKLRSLQNLDRKPNFVQKKKFQWLSMLKSCAVFKEDLKGFYFFYFQFFFNFKK